MKTNPHSTTRSLVLAALFLALAFVLPMITGHVPQVGNMLCPIGAVRHAAHVPHRHCHGL